ncbi:MAG: LptA/OstA family protein [Terriglobia bacterium]
MKPSLIKLIRRLALTGMVVATLVIAGNYGVRRWRASRVRSALPAGIRADVQQQAERFTFSRSDQGQTLFTVEASRTTERTGQTTVLEDVVVRIFGRRGDRADEIRTPRCNYDQKGTEKITCPDEVTIRLGGAGVPAAGTGRSILLVTTMVEFDTAQGVAWTRQPVRFTFPQGSGQAVGMRYQPREPRVQLESSVLIQVARGEEAPIEIQGAQLHYYTGTQSFELIPPLRLTVPDRTLVADRLRMELTPDYRTKRIEATGNVHLEGRQGERQLKGEATRAEATYDSEGRIERLLAQGDVHFAARGRESEETLTSRDATFTFDPSRRWVERIVASGNARLDSQTAKATRSLRAPVLELEFRAGGLDRQLLTARKRGTLVLEDRGGDQRTVVGDQITLEFVESKRLRSLAASGEVETQETRPDGQLRQTWSRELRARFDAEGDLAEAEQWGQFRYRGGDWQAEAGRAHYRTETDTIVLRQQPVVWDPTSRTRANTIELMQKTGSVRAEGQVRTTQEESAGNGHGFGSGEPIQLVAERMRADRNSNWARYEGQARLWQGESRLAAATIDLFRSPVRLVAEGNVTSLFVEAVPEDKQEESSSNRRRAVNVTAEKFTYREEERRGVFERSVRAWNDFGVLTAPRLEVFLAPGVGASSDRLERAWARGGVQIEQGNRLATGEEAEYLAAAQTVILWGGSPTLSDRERGTTTGARLTLFLVDGRISVDSDEGTRTLTRRSWSQ